MAVTTGISVAGHQVVAPFVAVSNTDWDVLFPGLQVVPPVRVGYAYILVMQPAISSNIWLVQREPIYRPGTSSKPRVDFGINGAQYSIWINWNFSGLSWRVNM